MRFDTLPTGMKNKNTVGFVESVSNDGACCVDVTTNSEASLENGRHVDMTSTSEDSSCTVNSTSKTYSVMVPSGVDGIQLTGNGLIVQKSELKE